jgi:hypothetical protein
MRTEASSNPTCDHFGFSCRQGTLPDLSNSDCLPGRAGGTPVGLGGPLGAVAAADAAKARRKPPASLQAYDYYLLAVDFMNRPSKENMSRAGRLGGHNARVFSHSVLEPGALVQKPIQAATASVAPPFSTR